MERAPRVMWLLGHTTARKFEVPMLKRIGIQEIFLPKMFPSDLGFRSGSVDYSEDVNLSIPPEDLVVLNQTDWCGGTPNREAWKIANRHFDVIFCILLYPENFQSILQNFQGAILWRAYGLEAERQYASILQLVFLGKKSVKSLTNRFWFAHAYDHLALNEPDHLQNCSTYLPLGMHNCAVQDRWEGNDSRIFFVCPQFATNSYYKQIYDRFTQDFIDFPYAIGGTQSLPSHDPRVLGYLSAADFDHVMQQMRVMYYHSTEPNHIHYHPFEAVRAGMPLVFMAGGMLDRLGGKLLPGRCKTIQAARQKIKRVLDDDRQLIEQIRQSQSVLLEAMHPDNCFQAWQTGFTKILSKLEQSRSQIRPIILARKQRIAVLLPLGYRGGSLRGAKLLAEAIKLGSQQAGEDVEVVLGHLDLPELYEPADFADLLPDIKVRSFQWKTLSADESRRAVTYWGGESVIAQAYQVPDDGMQQFMDCDLWVVVSDRLKLPLLPVRPYVMMVYDYLQRQEINLAKALTPFCWRQVAQSAAQVWVTTNFTHDQAINFAGIAAKRVRKLPMLAPEFKPREMTSTREADYFIWSTNLAAHKNHLNAFKALRLYYEEFDGTLRCVITGVDTKKLLGGKIDHLKALKGIRSSSPTLSSRLQVHGELSDRQYQQTLVNSQFLWHPARLDNGTFSVIEAAQLGIPSLSSDYPAMREIDVQFGLNLAWMNPHDPDDMALQLKQLEMQANEARSHLPTTSQLHQQSVAHLASAYWEAIQTCL